MSDYPKHLNRYATSADVARQTDSRYDPAASNHPPLRVGSPAPPEMADFAPFRYPYALPGN